MVQSPVVGKETFHDEGGVKKNGMPVLDRQVRITGVYR